MLGVKKKIQANEGQLFPLTTPAIAPHDEGPGRAARESEKKGPLRGPAGKLRYGGGRRRRGAAATSSPPPFSS